MYVSLINVYNFKIRDVSLFEIKAPAFALNPYA